VLCNPDGLIEPHCRQSAVCRPTFMSVVTRV